MFRAVFLVGLLALGTEVLAAPAGHVRELPSSDELILWLDGPASDGDAVIVWAQGRKEPVGYAIVRDVRVRNGAGALVLAKLHLHPRNHVVRVGDKVQVVDLSGASEDWPGRVDLQVRRADVSARYKRLSYPGTLFGRGHALERDEFVIEPLGSFRYGVTSWLTLETVPILYAAKDFNLAATFRVLDNDDVWFSAFVNLTLLTENRASLLTQAGGVLSFPTNTKFMSHLQVVAGVEFVGATLNVADAIRSEQGVTTEVRSRTEYVFDNWDRLLFGPLYNFDAGAVGGFLGYTMVFDHVYVGLAFQTVDFTNVTLDVFEGYTPWFTLFWRS